ncbi:small s protein [Fusarium austroafricanum]|uniref:Small s protein n=1 Tax=Fusarium austroafricanum TaxID=2364996 RepID=A0A8H4NS45_9HYPO|nr:small s protein [Fusarium austroafricanum]
MEPIGFTSAIASIPGVFKSCIDCFEYVQFARNFGDDFGVCLARLEATQMQFTRWGKAIGIFEDPFNPAGLQEIATEAEVKKALKWIGLIQDKFEAAKKNIRWEEQIDKTKPPLRKLVFSMRKITEARQRKTKLGTKIKWALYKNSHFEVLIEDVARLVDKITELFPYLETKQQDLAKEEAKEVEVESIPILTEILATQKTDKLLAMAIKEGVRAEGHVFRDVEINMNKDGLFRMGNTYQNVGGSASEAMRFEKIKVGGSGVQHAGHIFIQGTAKTHEAQRELEERLFMYGFGEYDI